MTRTKHLQKTKEKRLKYRPLRDEICKLKGVQNVTFYGLPIGSKGKWYESKNKLLSKLLGAAPVAGVLITSS